MPWLVSRVRLLSRHMRLFDTHACMSVIIQCVTPVPLTPRNCLPQGVNADSGPVGMLAAQNAGGGGGMDFGDGPGLQLIDDGDFPSLGDFNPHESIAETWARSQHQHQMVRH